MFLFYFWKYIFFFFTSNDTHINHTGHSLMRTLQTWVVETWRQLTLIIINGETGNYQKLNLAQLTANYCSKTERFNQNHSHVHLCLKCTVKKLKRFTFHKPPCSPGLCLAVMAIKQRTALSLPLLLYQATFVRTRDIHMSCWRAFGNGTVTIFLST